MDIDEEFPLKSASNLQLKNLECIKAMLDKLGPSTVQDDKLKKFLIYGFNEPMEIMEIEESFQSEEEIGKVDIHALLNDCSNLLDIWNENDLKKSLASLDLSGLNIKTFFDLLISKPIHAHCEASNFFLSLMVKCLMYDNFLSFLSFNDLFLALFLPFVVA